MHKSWKSWKGSVFIVNPSPSQAQVVKRVLVHSHTPTPLFHHLGLVHRTSRLLRLEQNNPKTHVEVAIVKTFLCSWKITKSRRDRPIPWQNYKLETATCTREIIICEVAWQEMGPARFNLPPQSKIRLPTITTLGSTQPHNTGSREFYGRCLQRNVDEERNWLAHNYFANYNFQRPINAHGSRGSVEGLMSCLGGDGNKKKLTSFPGLPGVGYQKKGHEKVMVLGEILTTSFIEYRQCI